ncbi:MAG: hypothetical protein KA436_06505 [Oligoflexales bacterium]|nr:hypothetical protein [Oligoflexales bacterium]
MPCKMRCVYFFIFMSFFLKEAQAKANTLSDSWVKVKEKDGVQIFTQHVPGNPLVAIKGEGLIAAPMEKVLAVLLDIPNTPQWIEYLAEAKIIKYNSPTDFFSYARFASPVFFVKDREFITHNLISYKHAEKSVYIEVVSSHESVSTKTQALRGTIMMSSMQLKSLNPQQTELCTILHADPKGMLPKWLVNFFIENVPLRSFTALRGRLQKVGEVKSPFAL